MASEIIRFSSSPPSTPGALTASHSLRESAPLFKKLHEGLIDEEYARLEG